MSGPRPIDYSRFDHIGESDGDDDDSASNEYLEDSDNDDSAGTAGPRLPPRPAPRSFRPKQQASGPPSRSGSEASDASDTDGSIPGLLDDGGSSGDDEAEPWRQQRAAERPAAPSSMPSGAASDRAAAAAANGVGTQEDVGSWGVGRLKAALAERGISTRGMLDRSELVAALRRSLTAAGAGGGSTGPPSAASSSAPSPAAFAPGFLNTQQRRQQQRDGDGSDSDEGMPGLVGDVSDNDSGSEGGMPGLVGDSSDNGSGSEGGMPDLVSDEDGGSGSDYSPPASAPRAAASSSGAGPSTSAQPSAAASSSSQQAAASKGKQQVQEEQTSEEEGDGESESGSMPGLMSGSASSSDAEDSVPVRQAPAARGSSNNGTVTIEEVLSDGVDEGADDEGELEAEAAAERERRREKNRKRREKRKEKAARDREAREAAAAAAAASERGDEEAGLMSGGGGEDDEPAVGSVAGAEEQGLGSAAADDDAGDASGSSSEVEADASGTEPGSADAVQSQQQQQHHHHQEEEEEGEGQDLFLEAGETVERLENAINSRQYDELQGAIAAAQQWLIVNAGVIHDQEVIRNMVGGHLEQARTAMQEVLREGGGPRPHFVPLAANGGGGSDALISQLMANLRTSSGGISTPAAPAVAVAPAAEEAAAATARRRAEEAERERLVRRGFNERPAANEVEDATPEDCIICLNARANFMVVPCGHITSCSQCTNMLRGSNARCPLCRGDIMRFKKVCWKCHGKKDLTPLDCNHAVLCSDCCRNQRQRGVGSWKCPQCPSVPPLY